MLANTQFATTQSRAPSPRGLAQVVSCVRYDRERRLHKQSGNDERHDQREPDEFDELVPYALVTTVGMPGVSEIYAQVSAKVSIKPKVQVQS